MIIKTSLSWVRIYSSWYKTWRQISTVLASARRQLSGFSTTSLMDHHRKLAFNRWETNLEMRMATLSTHSWAWLVSRYCNYCLFAVYAEVRISLSNRISRHTMLALTLAKHFISPRTRINTSCKSATERRKRQTASASWSVIIMQRLKCQSVRKGFR